MDKKSFASLCGLIIQCRTEGNKRMDIESDTRPLPQNERKVLFEHLTACGAVKNGNYWDFTAVDPEALLKIEAIKAPAVNLVGTELKTHFGTWKKDADGSWIFSYNQNCPDSGVSYGSSGHLHFDL
ncbi:MAG: hypothetical protein WAU62_03950 [Dehalococcoidales bacterium]